MGLWELVVTAFGLSLDAFAVSICKGLATPKVKLRHMAIAGGWFGGFQALMPLLGFLLGATFRVYIESVDHWIAFVLLALIGGNMIKEALSSEEEEADGSFGVKAMFVLAVATSIDAMVTGVALAMLPDVSIWVAITCIGAITFLMSAIGVKFGRICGERFQSKAELAGGIILILMGTKILLEHLEILHI